MSTSVYKTSAGWRGEVIFNGFRKTKRFKHKKDAERWVFVTERDLVLNAKSLDAMNAKNIVVTVAEALRRYSEEVSIKKKTAKKECQRIRYYIENLPCVDLPIQNYRVEYVLEWQNDVMNRAVRPLSAGSVLRDYALLGAFFSWCKLEKRWVDENVISLIPKSKRPKKPVHRCRRVGDDEVEKMLFAMDYRVGEVPKTKTQQVALVWLIAMATGMRSGEIISRRIVDVDIERCCVRIDVSKNGSARVVPLSEYAVSLWVLALRIDRLTDYRVFDLTDSSRDAIFRKMRKKAGLEGCDLTFHDSRHEAASVLAKKLSNPLTLCKVFGWKDPKFALVYYNPTNEEIVAELNAEC